jgi:hypothetical protein
VNLVEPHIASLFGLHLPPQLALFLTLAFIVFLFRRDIRENPMSAARFGFHSFGWCSVAQDRLPHGSTSSACP